MKFDFLKLFPHPIIMKLVLPFMSAYMAAKHVPKEPTVALRILNSPAAIDITRSHYPEFTRHEDYVEVREYTFDDIEPHQEEGGLILFDEAIARKIITDFEAYRKRAKFLLIHCTQGNSRSPAVGSALNDVFRLGHDPLELVSGYMPNHYVYGILIQTAEKMGRISAKRRREIMSS